MFKKQSRGQCAGAACMRGAVEGDEDTEVIGPSLRELVGRGKE